MFSCYDFRLQDSKGLIFLDEFESPNPATETKNQAVKKDTRAIIPLGSEGDSHESAYIMIKMIMMI